MNGLPSNTITATGEVHYCVNCKYSMPAEHVQENLICTYAISLVTGQPKKTSCTFERSGSGHCGPQAIHFVQEEPRP